MTSGCATQAEPPATSSTVRAGRRLDAGRDIGIPPSHGVIPSGAHGGFPLDGIPACGVLAQFRGPLALPKNSLTGYQEPWMIVGPLQVHGSRQSHFR